MELNRHYQGTEFITGLRAIAVLLVFLIHSGGGGLRSLGIEFNSLVDWGKHGVEIFFVISGFTVFHQILGRKYTFKKFLLVRILRISLPYWPLLIALYLISNHLTHGTYSDWGSSFNDGQISIDNLLAHMSYISFANIKYSNTIIGVEWTLSIEVFYYLLIGYIITSDFFTKSSVAISFIFGIALFAIYHTADGLIVMNRVDNYLTIHWSPMKYGFMFLLGGAVHFIRKELDINYKQETLILASNISIFLAIALFLTNLNYLFFQHIDIFFTLLTFMLLTFVRDNSFFSILLNNKVLIFIGSISFSFYLWHMIVIKEQYLLIPYVIGDVQLTFMYRLLLTIIISTAWYIVFEKYLYANLKSRVLRISTLKTTKQEKRGTETR